MAERKKRLCSRSRERKIKMSAYENVSRGALKLKGVSDSGMKKKKKKKSKEKERERLMLEQAQQQQANSDDGASSSQKEYRTKAEEAYIERKKALKQQELLKMASKTHKERIMEFNEKLGNLSEHYDIPKVSWTKFVLCVHIMYARNK
ncbi:unnamed protein product [Owenia fusiformis]|uniref:Uncharacterized protein n=1 Tax=Owenia fusiformis TaxID=6347 RepID=A0A8J1UCV9_OWEFU|nr:unnamed protein product [Owenia fusiformis]